MNRKWLLTSLAVSAFVIVPSFLGAQVLRRAGGFDSPASNAAINKKVKTEPQSPLMLSLNNDIVGMPVESFGQRLVNDFKANGWELPYPEDRMLMLHPTKAPQNVAVTPPEEPVYFTGFLQYAYKDGGVYLPYGLYAFNTADGMKRELYADVDWNINLGGAYYNDKLHGTSNVPIPDRQNSTTYYVEWDADTWESIEGRHMTDVYGSLNSGITGYKNVAYNPVDSMCYGVTMWNTFAKFNYETNEYEAISETDVMISAFAINSKGEAFVATENSELCRINLQTGELTTIGSLGYNTVTIHQSMAFDNKDNLYYAANILNDENGSANAGGFYGGMLAVDTATGKADLIGLFPESEEYYVLNVLTIPADGAPADIEDLSVTYEGDTNNGVIKFTMPSTAVSGQPLSANVEYEVTINYSGTVSYSGVSTPGSLVEIPFSAPDAGRNKVVVVLKNENGSGNRNAVESWAGYDLPAVKNVSFELEEATGDAEVSWTVEARKGGYLDSEKVSYRVERLPDNVLIVDSITVTTLTDNLSEVPYNGYSYKVTPICGQEEGESATSNVIKTGKQAEMPFFDDFESDNAASKYEVIDANGDGETWVVNVPTVSPGKMIYSRHGNNVADDWILTPPFKMSPDYLYDLNMKWGGIASHFPEELTVYVGEGSDVSSFREIMPTTAPFGTIAAPADTTISFSVDKEGLFRVAFRCTSPAESRALFIEEMGISQSVLRFAPASVENVVLIPGEEGDLEVSIELDAPTKNNIGETIDKIDRIEILRGEKRELVDNIINPAPGSHISITDDNAVNGYVPYYFIAYNEAGEGALCEKYVYVGIDSPSLPEDIITYDNLDGTATIEWKAPSKGQHEGYVDADDVTYSIYSFDDNNGLELLEQDIEECSYVVEVPEKGEQRMLFYFVKATNELGESEPAQAPTFKAGSLYSIPYMEGFVMNALNGLWISNQAEGNAAMSSIFEGETIDFDGNLGGAIGTAPQSWASLTSANISLAGAQHPMLVFARMPLVGFDNTLKVIIRKDGGKESDTVLTFNDKDSKGDMQWETVKYDLHAYKDAKYIDVTFMFEINDMEYPYVLIDDVNIRDVADDDLSIQSDVPMHAMVGAPARIPFIVHNVGDKEATGFTVNLYVNDELAESKIFNDVVPSFRRLRGEITYTPTQGNDDNTTVKAEVVYDIDSNVADNESEEMIMNVVAPLWNVPLDLTANEDDGNVILQWTAPDKENTVTESFEGYDTFITEGFGEWKTVDVDMSQTSTIQGFDFPNSGKPFAFMTFDFEALGIDTNVNPIYAGHTGSQMALSMMGWNTNNDWLISPELSGDSQVIKFYVRALNGYGNSFEVLYSVSDDEVDSFTEKIYENQTAYLDTNWIEVELELPDGAKYFAIRNTGNMGGMFVVDDVTYTGKPLTLIGYNVYRDLEKIGETNAENNSFSIKSMEGKHIYNVSAVYVEGESGLSNSVETISTGIDGIDADAVSDDAIYDIYGRRMPEGHKLQKGVYVRNHRKVMVK